MKRGSGLVAAMSVTIARPSTWPLALGAFLLRGGMVLVLLPIIVLPTPVGVGNLVAPAVMSISLGALPLGLVIASVGLGIGFALWVVIGGWLAAALEGEGVRIVADATRDHLLATSRRRVAGRILAARLVCLFPLAVVLALGTVRIVFVTYSELVLPSDAASPIAIRVLRDAPDVPLVIALTWMAGEILAAVAARRIVLAGDGVGAALRIAVARSIRHPLSALARFWLPLVVFVGLLVAAGLVVSVTWQATGERLGDARDPIGLLGAMVMVALLVGSWLLGLLLIGVVTAWRGAVWTVAEVSAAGTFGGSTNRRRGDWRVDPRSATL